jgi:putative transposase
MLISASRLWKKPWLGSDGRRASIASDSAPPVRALARAQGSQFTSTVFTGMLETAGIRISMDGKGRCMDNIFIERLWRSLKYEDIDLRAYATGSEARLGIGHWMSAYNAIRPHQALGYQTPDEVFYAIPSRFGATSALATVAA